MIMTQDEFDSKRDDIRSRVNDLNGQQAARDEAYKQKCKSGEVSGFEKVCHGLGKILQGLVNAGSKMMDRM